MDETKRTAEFSVSSEYPVERWFGYEILDHNAGSIRLERFKDGAAHRDTHYGDQIGIIEAVWLDQMERKLRIRVRYSKSARGSEIFQDVLDGIRKNVSIRYEIHELVLEKEVDGVSTYRITDWEPIHSSEEADGADPTVGHERTADDDEPAETILPLQLDSSKPIQDQIDEFNSKNERKLKIIVTQKTRSTNPMTEEEKRAMEEAHKLAIAEATKSAEQKASERIADIYAIADDFQKNVPGVNLREEAKKAVAENKSSNEFRVFVMSELKKPTALRTPATDIGLSEKEKNKFSIRKAILAMVDGRVDTLGVEYEASKVIADKLGRSQLKNNLFLPYEIQNRQIVLPKQRDLIVGTDASGGFTVKKEYPAQSFIEILQDSNALVQAGVTVIENLQGKVPMTRELSSNIFYMAAESAGPTQSDITFGQAEYGPETGGALTKMSHKFLLQNSIGGEAYATRKLAMAIALGISAEGLRGSGTTPHPRGLKNWSGLGGVTGAGFTRAKAIDMIAQIKTANALTLGEIKWLANAVTAATLMGIDVTTGGNGRWLLDDITGRMLNYALIDSNQPADGELYIGIWTAMMLLMWGIVELQANPFGSGWRAGDVEVRGLVDFNTYVEYPGAFALATGVTA